MVSFDGLISTRTIDKFEDDCAAAEKMTYERKLTETRGRVGLLSLNQTDKLNTMSNVMNREVPKAIAPWNADGSVGAIVITGARRGLCSGADIGGVAEVVRGDAPATWVTLIAPKVSTWKNQ